MKWIIPMCIANMKLRGIRTVLTVLGVVIGVISILSLLAIGLGVKEVLLSDLDADGGSTEIFVYGTEGKRKELMLTDRTLLSISELEHIDSVYPELALNGPYMYGNYEGYMPIYGVPREYMEEMDLLYGRLPEESMVKPELLVGKHALDDCYNFKTGVANVEDYRAENLAKGEEEDKVPDYTGKTLKMLSLGEGSEALHTLSIVGVTENESYLIYCDIEELKAYLKKNSADGVIAGQPLDANDQPYTEWIYETAVVRVDETENVDAVLKKIRNMGFRAESNKEYIDMVEKSTRIIQWMLGGIGAIALVVAVIGIGNTMTTAVYDRVHDIGVLKVLGCDPEELLLLFLIESGILGGIGGAIGVGLSYLVSELLINRLAVYLLHLEKGTDLSIIPVPLAIAAFFGAILLGMLAGFLPARWASKLRPVKAILS